MYGFNPPVVAEYQRRWGVDILTEPFDVEKWKQLQGEYFTLFLRELKQELARHRLPLQVSVNYLMLRKLSWWRKNNVPMNFAYEWEKWIAEDIADSIELKYIPWRWGAYRGRGEELIEQAAKLARKHNKPVFTNVRFESRIPWWEVQAEGKPPISLQDERLAGLRQDLRRAWHNPLLDGVILYEGAGFTRMDREKGETLVAPFVFPGTGDDAGTIPERVFSAVEAEQFCQTLDFLLLAIPQTPANEGLINRRLFETLPDHAFLLNPARGKLVCEADLLWALETRQIAGAALDTHFHYPLPPDHPLWQMPNVILTPHIAGSSQSPHFTDRLWQLFCTNVRRWQASQTLYNLLSHDQLEPGLA